MYTRTYIHICRSIQTCTHAHTFTYAHTCTQTYTHMYIHTYIHIYTQKYAHMYTRTYIHICTHMHTDVYTHVHTHRSIHTSICKCTHLKHAHTHVIHNIMGAGTMGTGTPNISPSQPLPILDCEYYSNGASCLFANTLLTPRSLVLTETFRFFFTTEIWFDKCNQWVYVW